MEPPKWFGSEWNNATSDPLTYGTCEVSIPVAQHELGEVKKRSLFRILIRDPEDPKRDVIVREPQRFARNKFFEALAGEVAARAEKEVIVFIHGFNNTFDDAASRLGVLAYDLKFDGVPVLYSWSSTGGWLGWTPGSYWHDEQIVTKTEGALTDFLASVTQTARAAGAQRVNVVAHSMGNRPLVAALRSLAEREGDKITIDEVVMAAPDVQQDGFADTYWRKLECPGGVAERVTLYASSEDEALVMSRRLHSGFRRIGEGGNNFLCLPGLDTVDASGCDFHRFGLNHTYFGGPRVITDLAKILNPGLDPLKRKLRQIKQREFGYWMLPELAP
jgi:esterase/lipase superfamily enzyme